MSELKSVDRIEYHLEFSEDLYTAFLSIKKEEASEPITRKAIEDHLKKNNVTYGIDQFAIEKLVRENIDVQKAVVARGESHIDGADSRIEYQFDRSDSKPKINEDGSIDFKNIDKYVSVEAGRLLAIKIPATAEKNGINVFGKIVMAKKGKLKNFIFGKNVVQSEDGLKLYAVKNGSVELVGEKISVLDVLELVDDVGPKTGNIEFSGKVIVHGNVLNGYRIDAEGDVIVNGIIEGAQVSTAGDLIVYYGIQGQGGAKISVQGDVVAKFINNASLTCEGDIETGAVVHSAVRCNGSISLTNHKGLIVGGTVYAKRQIKAKQLGTEIGAKTLVCVGLTQEIVAKRAQWKKQLSSLEENIDKLEKLDQLLKAPQSSKLEHLEQQMLKVSSSLSHLREQRQTLQTDLAELEQEIRQLKKAFIRSDLIYNGVVVEIDEVKYSVMETMYRSDIKMTMGEIYITNY